jgi:hypothetical protein
MACSTPNCGDAEITGAWIDEAAAIPQEDLDRLLAGSRPRLVCDGGEAAHVVYPIGTLTGEAKAHADRLLAASFKQTAAIVRKLA